MSNTIDQQFIEYIVKSLVGHPDDVQIERTIDEKGVLLELTVNPEDLGRVIGKRGATAQSLRTLLRALGTKNDARYNLKIIDNGEPRPRYGDEPQTEGAEHQYDDAPAPAAQTQADTPAPVATSTGDDDDFDSLDSEELPTEASHEDLAQKTRAELADLDDLDL